MNNRIVTYCLSTLLALLALFFLSCEKRNSLDSPIQKFIESQITLKNPDEFLKLYDESLVYKDVMYEEEIRGKDEYYKAIQSNWKDSLRRFHEDFPKAIVVEETYINDNTAIIKGMMTPYYYNNTVIEHKNFITYLKFNEKGKIVEHTDWIDYPIERVIEYRNLKENLEKAVIGNQIPDVGE